MSTSRSLRRAAERAARKQSREEMHLTDSVETLPNTPATSGPGVSDAPRSSDHLSELTASTPDSSHCSAARMAANQANAQFSTGPITPEGKAKSSKNAVRTALTGRTVLLPGDDADHYADRLAQYAKLYRPVGVREIEIVQALCDTWWRLERIPGLIEALYVKGFAEFKDAVKDIEPAAQSTMLRMETYVAYERHFRNLQTQEQRLYRYAEKLRAELSALQQERAASEAEAANNTKSPHDRTATSPLSSVPSHSVGFEFSTGNSEPDSASVGSKSADRKLGGSAAAR